MVVVLVNYLDRKRMLVRIYLKSDPPGTGTNVPLGEEEIPLANETNSFRAGPSLPHTIAGDGVLPPGLINV